MESSTMGILRYLGQLFYKKKMLRLEYGSETPRPFSQLCQTDQPSDNRPIDIRRDVLIGKFHFQ